MLLLLYSFIHLLLLLLLFCIWFGGDCYIGEFKEGLKHGQGTKYSKDGTVQSGKWNENKFVG